MKRLYFLLLIIATIFSGCKKDDTVSGSGTVTIDNTLYGTGPYYEKGFSFASAKKISTLEDPGPDIVLYVNIDNPPNKLTLQADNLNPSFFKIGDYPDAQSAISSFEALKTVGDYLWADMADPIADNQVWVFRTGNSCYAKFRIISTVNTVKNSIPYGECKLEWLYQPDGSKTFPGK